MNLNYLRASFFTLLFFGLTFSIVAQEIPEPTEQEALLEILVTDYDKVPEEGALVIVESTDKKVRKEGKTNIDGMVYILAPEGKGYKFTVKKFGHDFAFEDPTEIPSEEGAFALSQVLAIRVVTKYIRSYKLENVYFDSNKSDLKPGSYNSLNALYQAMMNNPKMKVEIAGHTDNVGDDKSNLQLSQKRADAIVDYLIKKGISANRLIAKGYGELKPSASNDTEDGRAQNRRTEVKVIEE